MQKGIDCAACNALLLKVNQIGSVTEAIEAATMAKEKGRVEGELKSFLKRFLKVF